MTEQTTEYKFNNAEAQPSFKQLSLYGRKYAESTLGKTSDKITQSNASDVIANLKAKLEQEPDNFELKNGDGVATFSQFGLIGKLSAELNGITTMQSISEAIAKFN